MVMSLSPSDPYSLRPAMNLAPQRPPSSGSSTSLQSSQSNRLSMASMDGQFALGGHQQTPQDPFQYNPEALLMQSMQQHGHPSASNPEYGIDPSLEPPQLHMQRHAMQNHHPETRQYMHMPTQARFQTVPVVDEVIDESQSIDADQETKPEVLAGSGSEGKKKKKGSNPSTASDNELRLLFKQNESRTLGEVAIQSQTRDRGPQAEKTKQLFAMLWLKKACDRGPASVPRSRVFAQYASRCANEHVTALNPASFGKLVRVMFPGIQTRRLGIRGESKYHYCGLTLLEGSKETNPDTQVPGRHHSVDRLKNASSRFSKSSQLTTDTAVFPSPGASYALHGAIPASRRSVATGSLFTGPMISKNMSTLSQGNMIRRTLRFAATVEPPFEQKEPIELPKLDEYIPPGTDADCVATLTALYRSHCTSLIDCIRFCKEKPFFHHFTSFYGLLTVPVQRLLANSCLAPWVKECDSMMYRTMIRLVAHLILQVVPKQVLLTLKKISENIVPHIKSTFQNQPPHILEAKLGPATIFASLLDRLLKVNESAHAACNILCNDANRDQMWRDWVLHVKPVRIVEAELPNCGYEQVLEILTADIRRLLEPLQIDTELESGSIFPQSARSPLSTYQQQPNPSSLAEGVLDRWSDFLCGLPDRFPQADARVILSCVNGVGTAALRDITLGQGRSFGSWWIIKVFIDEMTSWLVEVGGFLYEAPTKSSGAGTALLLDTNTDGFDDVPRSGVTSFSDSPFGDMDVDGSGAVIYGQRNGGQDVGQSGPADSIHQGVLHDESTLGHDPDHDDSGVGLSITEDDLGMSNKFGEFLDSDINSEHVAVC